MWSSIKHIDFPRSFNEAIILSDSEYSAFFSGGTYLVSEKSPNIKRLIDVNALLDKRISMDDGKVVIGAAATLQDIVNFFNETGYSLLAESAKMSCPSKNIRNQRTIGGEICQCRPDSELMICLYALNANLLVYINDETEMNIRDWDRNGIITSVTIPLLEETKLSIQRFASLPSARAFVIAAGVKSGNMINLTVGGTIEKINCASFKNEKNQKFPPDFIKVINPVFTSDQYGTGDYKRKLCEIALNRVGEELC